MSHEFKPTLEVENWWESELSAAEEGELAATFWSAVDFLYGNSFVNNAEDPEAFRCKIETGELDNPATIIRLKAKALPAGPIANLSLDEKLHPVAGTEGRTTVWRRTNFSLDAASANPFAIDITHSLKRRSKHRFAKPKDDYERGLLEDLGHFHTDHPRQQDKLLLEAALTSLLLRVCEADRQEEVPTVLELAED